MFEVYIGWINFLFFKEIVFHFQLASMTSKAQFVFEDNVISDQMRWNFEARWHFNDTSLK
jgi:hypothetical protein